MRYPIYTEAEFAKMNKARGGGQAPGLRVGVTRNSLVRGPGRIERTLQDGGSQVRKLAPSPFRSPWEAAYAQKLELEKRAGLIHRYWHEPWSMWLPGKVRYKPDFLVEYSSGELEMIEVKGWSKNRRDGITRLKMAAALFPCFTWRLVYRTKGGGFDGEYV